MYSALSETPELAQVNTENQVERIPSKVELGVES
jgi:hypothetical protein